jgi:UDP-N-acetylmuramoylalanine--D-glutamate ligase
VALAAFDVPVHLILGGQGKGQDFTALRDAVTARARAVYLIGEDAERVAAALGDAVALRRCGDLERAVAAARAAARPGEVVLLSPACASFDQYTDFEERGRHFKALVEG